MGCCNTEGKIRTRTQALKELSYSCCTTQAAKKDNEANA